MPMTSAQLAALVERARLKAPPVVATPPAPRRNLSDKPPQPEPAEQPTQPTPPAPPPRLRPELPSLPTSAPEAAAADDFPIGWELRKESWHFHRRFFAIFKRPMASSGTSRTVYQTLLPSVSPAAWLARQGVY